MNVRLIVTSGRRAGQEVSITEEKFIIGRAADCHLKPMSELISRYHCAILLGKDVVVRDLGSRNGVRLNGVKIDKEHKLTHGDTLVLGPLIFRVHITDDGRPAIKDSEFSDLYLPSDNEERSAEPLDPTVLYDGSKKTTESGLTT